MVGQAPPNQFQEIAIPARRSESRTGFARGTHTGLRRPFPSITLRVNSLRSLRLALLSQGRQGRLAGDG